MREDDGAEFISDSSKPKRSRHCKEEPAHNNVTGAISGKACAGDDTKPGYLPIPTSPSAFADFKGRYLRAMGRGFCSYFMTEHLRLYLMHWFFFSHEKIRLNQSMVADGFFRGKK